MGQSQYPNYTRGPFHALCLLGAGSEGAYGCLGFAGEYVTKDVGPEYLELLEKSVRTKDRSRPGRQLASLNGAPPAVAAIASTAA